MRLLSSEWLKTKRTAVRWLTFFMPVVLAICTVAYLVIRQDGTQAFAFEGFFTIWAGLIMPIIVGVLAGFVVQEEEFAGNYVGFLGTGVSRTKLFWGKFVLLALCLTICTLLAALVLSAGMGLFVPCGVDVGLFLFAALFISIATLPLIALHLWASFAGSMGVSIAISVCGLLMGIIFGTTSLGTGIWQFITWTWPIKLGLLPGTTLIETAQNASAYAMNTGMVAFVVTAFALIALLSCGMLWFRKWEGRKASE